MNYATNPVVVATSVRQVAWELDESLIPSDFTNSTELFPGQAGGPFGRSLSNIFWRLAGSPQAGNQKGAEVTNDEIRRELSKAETQLQFHEDQIDALTRGRISQIAQIRENGLLRHGRPSAKNCSTNWC